MSANLEEVSGDESESHEQEAQKMNTEPQRQPPEKPAPPLPVGRHRATLPTSDGVVSLEIPEGLSATNGDFIQNWVQLILKMHIKSVS